MARKKNATKIKEPDEYRGLVRLAMLDFRGRHQRKRDRNKRYQPFAGVRLTNLSAPILLGLALYRWRIRIFDPEPKR